MRVLQQSLRTIREVLREIFDEAAYARYLSRHSAESSPESYRRFLHENRQAGESRPRCC